VGSQADVVGPPRLVDIQPLLFWASFLCELMNPFDNLSRSVNLFQRAFATRLCFFDFGRVSRKPIQARFSIHRRCCERLDAGRSRGRAQTTEYESVNPIRLEYQSSPLILQLELIDESRQNYVEFPRA
jgi:hypothetical protein